MARPDDTEVIDRFEEFYRSYYRNEIADLAQKYPSDQKSLYIDWRDLSRFDTDLADDFRNKPTQLRRYAEEALRLYDLPVDVSLGQAHVRVAGLPETTDIRAIRSDHRGMLIAVQGIIRKSTDVRPKVTTAAFECQRCGTLSRVPQDSSGFQEPHECQGCERQGPFQINYDQSEFIDAQKLRVQESPEGLRGGETPQSIDVNIEDDITGEVTPGDHVSITGVLKLEQQGSQQEKSPMFDIYMEGLAVEIEDEEFEEMDITDEDKKEIIELSNEPDIYEQIEGAIAPSIYGYEREKLAMALQLFSGVTKFLPDGSRTRGDLHMLLIGDPGTGKCISPEQQIRRYDGSRERIGELVEQHLNDPVPVEDGFYADVNIPVPTLQSDGTLGEGRATKVWKREAPEEMYRIRLANGREIEVTPSHPLFVQSNCSFSHTRAKNLREGEFVAAARSLPSSANNSIDIEIQRAEKGNPNSLKVPEEITPSLARLLGYIVAEGHTDRGTVTVTNKDPQIINDVTEALDQLQLRHTVRDHSTADNVQRVDCHSAEFVRFLEELEPAILERSGEQRVPEQLFRTSHNIQVEFLRGYIEGEAHVSRKEREITVSSMSRELLDGVQSLLLSVGIETRIQPRKNGSYRLRISGENFVEYSKQIGFTTERKANAASAFDRTTRNTNTDIVPNLSEPLREVREALALTQHDCGLPRSTYQHYERGDRNPGLESLTTVVAAFEDRLRALKELRNQVESGEWAAIRAARTELSISQQSLADGIGITQTAISYHEREDSVPDGSHVDEARVVVLDRIDEALSVESEVRRLRALAEADVRWNRIDSIETVEPDYEWVYDLEVAETHNYISEGVLSHNSALLQYVNNIAPRSVYTSGKGATSAGLTAAAVRDDFGDGQQWTLEAGALVLADQGIAAVDELDKMRCVTGDTLVHTAEGIRPIRELAFDADRDGDIKHHETGRTFRNIDHAVWTMSETGQLTVRDITAVHEYDAPSELCTVALESGESLTATPEHPFFVLDQGKKTERPASELKPGDWVYVPDSIPTPASDGGILTAPAGGETPATTVTPEHGAVLGYIAGDGNVYYDSKQGYGIRFTNKEEELLTDFECACREIFDTEPVRPPGEQRDDSVETAHVFGKAYVKELLAAGVNLKTYEGKRVPAAVGQGSSDVKAAFIRALADSEGTVDYNEVTISSASYELLLGTKMLLAEFGITAQIQTDQRDDRRDIYILAVTAADSLARFRDQIGFVLDRKQSALDAVFERVSGDRTVLDVLPECGTLFAEARESLRLFQSECGLNDATYCNFENGDASVSLSKAERVLERFANRREEAKSDAETLGTACSWKTLSELKKRYHVPQHELADRTEYSQQRVSAQWGEDEQLRDVVRGRVQTLLDDVGDTDLSELRDLIRGDVKWRRVTDVAETEPTVTDGQIPILKHRLVDLLQADKTKAEQRAAELLGTEPTAESWSELRDELERHAMPLQRIADRMDVANSTVSRWCNGLVDGESFETVWEVASDLLEAKRRRVRALIAELEDRREPNVYDLTVEGTHNFLANGMVVHNSDDQSAMHQALEEQSYHPTTEVLTSDGRRVEIGDFVDRKMEANPSEVVDGVDCEILPVDDEGVHTVDLETNEVEKTGLDRVSRHEAPEEFVRVELSNGREVLVTPDHPMFVADDEVRTVEAQDLSEGAFVPAPRKLPNHTEPVQLTPEPQIGKEKDVDLPDTLTPDLGEILGFIVAEGHTRAGSSHEIGFSNQDERLLNRMERLMSSVFGMESSEHTNPAGTVTKVWVSTKLYRWFESNVPEVMPTAREKRVPAAVLGSSEEVIRRFLVGAFAGDGGVESNELTLSTASTGLAQDYADALLKLGVASRIHHDSTHDSWKVCVMGDSTERFVDRVVREADERYEKTRALVERGNETPRHHDVLPTGAARELRALRTLLGLQLTGRYRKSLDRGYGVQCESVERELAALRERVETVRTELDEADDLVAVRAAIGWSCRQLSEHLDGETRSAINYAEQGGYDTQRRHSLADRAREAVQTALETSEQRIETLEQRLELRYYRVTSVETVPNEGGYACDWVYDVTVEPTNTFVGQGVVLHNSISVNKAGINATLKSRCSLLGAANPTMGRFDKYEPMAEQIDLSPPLISRFDLIFTVTDQPDPEEDAELAEHIIQTNYAGELNTHRTEVNSSNYSAEEVDRVTEEVAPTIEPDLLRKYVAFARRTCYPTMTEEAKSRIQEFYVDLRAEGTGEDSPVPVTARKLEALVRMAEASARVRLSDTVEREDADRAVDIAHYCLKEIGLDPETGELDADVIETGTSKTQRDRVKNLLDIVADIENEYDEGAPVDVVVERAEEVGVSPDKAEHEIEKLKQKGEIYQPQKDHLRTT
jgi:replicative DNA helicase Mcm